jgi:hypothetical protein
MKRALAPPTPLAKVGIALHPTLSAFADLALIALFGL